MPSVQLFKAVWCLEWEFIAIRYTYAGSIVMLSSANLRIPQRGKSTKDRHTGLRIGVLLQSCSVQETRKDGQSSDSIGSCSVSLMMAAPATNS
jgi:hypothetical protein